MKIIGCLLVIGILFSYAPVFHMDECQEGDQLGNMKMGCGVPFHCPMIANILVSEISNLPLNSLLAPTKMLLLMDGLTIPIFHPPRYPDSNVIPQGMKRKKQACLRLRGLAQELRSSLIEVLSIKKLVLVSD